MAIDAREVFANVQLDITIRHLNRTLWRAKLAILLLRLASWIAPMPVQIHDPDTQEGSQR